MKLEGATAKEEAEEAEEEEPAPRRGEARDARRPPLPSLLPPHVSSPSGAVLDAKNGVRVPARATTPLRSTAAVRLCAGVSPGCGASSWDLAMENRLSSRKDASARFRASNAWAPDRNSSS